MNETLSPALILEILNKILNDLESLKKTIKPAPDPTPPHTDRLLSTKEVVKLCGICPKTLQTWRKIGLLSFSKVGNKIFYQWADIQKLMNKARVSRYR